MINVSLENLGKKFNREWIFRNVNLEIKFKDKLVILGGNGSGKSTLLQVISGYVSPNEGFLSYQNTEGKKIATENFQNQLSFASPYLQLIEDFNAEELVQHISLFKPFTNKISGSQLLEIAELTTARHKFIRQYSSGMKQRLKLALAILADTPILLLDEPFSNLDKQATDWYHKMMNEFALEKTVIICSNAISEEYFLCDKSLNVMDYKK